MAVDNKVSIEIVLDDGSVKRGFATIKKEAEDTGKSVEKNLNSNVEDIPISLNKVKLAFAGLAAGVAAVGVAIKKAFDLSLFGEKIIATRAQFDNLANGAGVSGEKIRQEFERVGDGLVDIEDLLEKASVRVTQLGTNSEKLPQVLEAARRVAFATGQDVIQVFDGISNGIATGNARALRQFGLIVDIDKATKEYAKSLGLGVNNLTEQQRQAAALSATINQVNERFGNVDQSLTPLSTSLTRLRESAKDAFDSIAIASNELFGPGFQAVAEAVTTALSKFNDSVKQTQGGSEGAAARIRVLKEEIKSLQELAAAPFTNAGLATDLGGVSGITKKISEYSKEIEILSATIKALEEDQRRSNLAAEADVIIKEQQTLAAQKLEQATKNQALISQQNIAFLQAEIAAKQGQLQLIAQEEQKALLEQQIREDQRRLIVLQSEQQILAIKKQFSEEAGFTAQERARLEIQAEQIKNANLKNLEEQRIADYKATQEQLRREQQITQATTAAVNSAIVQTTRETFSRLGASLVQGSAAFKDFGKAILNIVGDLAINLGSTLISIGLGIDALRTALTTLTGGLAIAAGAALIVLGGALKGAAGGALTSAGTSGVSTDLGVGNVNENIAQPTNENDLQRNPGTVINVAFEGDVIGDSADTGSRIVQLINDAFDKQGVVLRQGVV